MWRCRLCSTVSWRRPRSKSSPRSTSSSPPRWRRSGPSRCRSPSGDGDPARQYRGGDHRGAGRRLWQYRLYGPGTRAGNPWAGGSGAGGTDLLLRQYHPVHHGAVPDGAGQAATGEHRHHRARSRQAHRLASADHRERARRCLGGDAFPAAGRARTADAVSAERRGAVRAVHARGDGGAAAIEEDAVGSAVPHAGEARRPPDADLPAAVTVRTVRPDLGLHRGADGALPPALNVFVFARQYDVWVEQASSAVLVGTLVSVVTLTSVMWMVKTGTLPQLLFR